MSEEYIVKIPNPSSKWPKPIFCAFMKKFTVTMGKVKWRKRFFVLNMDGKLFYFKNKKSTSPRKPPVIIKDVEFSRSHVKCNCICVRRPEEKPFYIHTEEKPVMDNFIQRLSVAGGIEREPRIVEDFIPEIANKKAKDWNQELVFDWLNTQFLGIDKTFMEYSENLYVNGKTLLELSVTSLRERGITESDHADRIFSSIQILKENDGEFDYGAHIITQKIVRNILRKKKGKIRNIEYVRGVVRELYVVSQIMSHYLDLSPPPRMSSIDPILQVFEFEEMESLLGDPDSDDMPVIPLDGTYLNLAHETKLPPTYPKSLDFKRISKIVLVVSDRLDYSEFEKCPTILSPLMTAFPQTEPGRLRIGVVIGPWYLSFNKIGLVIPKRINSVLLKTTSIYDSVEIGESVEISEAQQLLSQLVAKWNITKIYDEKLSNGYHFIDELFFMFGVEVLAEKSPIVNFLKPLKENGSMNYQITPSEKFCKEYGLEVGKTITFNNHQELDRFVLQDICRNDMDDVSLSVDFPGEYEMLKCIDRAFWLSHFNDPKEEKYMPLLEKESSKFVDGKYYSYWKNSKCIFDDPRRSMDDMWFFENESIRGSGGFRKKK